MTASRSTSKIDPERSIAAGRVGGVAVLPGSKSVTQRFLALASLRGEPTRILDPLLSDDIRHFCGGLRVLGLGVEEGARGIDVVPDRPAEAGEIWCGAGGTMMRLMTGLLAARPGRWRLDGTPRLRERPIGALVAALRELGADVRCPEVEGFPPLEIEGGLPGGSTRIDAGQSSQFLSALLLAGLGAGGPIEVEVLELASRPYVDLTVDAIRLFGGRVAVDGSRWRVEPGLAEDGPREVRVEGDWSAAAYPAAAATLTGGTVLLRGLDAGSAQGDRRFLEVLGAIGARIEPEADGVRVTGPGHPVAVDVSLADLPDQVPTLAALAPFCAGTTRIRDVAHLRLKESDRLRAMATELRRIGAVVEELDDGLRIEGVWGPGSAEPPRDPVRIETWDDHRIAMAMAVAGLRRPGLRIAEPGVVAKSWPGFWESFESWCAGKDGEGSGG